MHTFNEIVKRKKAFYIGKNDLEINLSIFIMQNFNHIKCNFPARKLWLVKMLSVYFGKPLATVSKNVNVNPWDLIKHNK